MNATTFWTIVDEAAKKAKGDQDKFISALTKKLKAFSPEEIVAFDGQFRAQMDRLYTWELWGAAYLILGGCSDDGFEYFRAWVISQGKAVAEAAATAPDSLAKLDIDEPELCEFEMFLYVTAEVYEEVAEEELPPRTTPMPSEPAGESFDFDDTEEMTARYPKLAAKFLDGDGEDEDEDD